MLRTVFFLFTTIVMNISSSNENTIIHEKIEDNDYIPAECIISVRNSETLPLKEFADCIQKNSDVEDHEILNALKDTEHCNLAEKHLDRALFT